MSELRCMCGDPECSSCGTAQGFGPGVLDALEAAAIAEQPDEAAGFEEGRDDWAAGRKDNSMWDRDTVRARGYRAGWRAASRGEAG